MTIEVQNLWDYDSVCKGNPRSCQSPTVQDLTVKGNYQRNAHLPYWGTFGYSLVPGGGAVNVRYLNNTAVNLQSDGCYAWLGYGIENSGQNNLTQGNVIASERTGKCKQEGWAGPGIVLGEATDNSARYNLVNNVICGPEASKGPDWEGKGKGKAGTLSEISNYKSETCSSGKPGEPNLNIVFTSPGDQKLQLSGKGTWTVTVNSTLSVKYVEFFLDKSTTPVVTQELQDVNANFAKDLKWLYHASPDLSGVAAGVHTITAAATDVSGLTKSVTDSFTIGH